MGGTLGRGVRMALAMSSWLAVLVASYYSSLLSPARLCLSGVGVLVLVIIGVRGVYIAAPPPRPGGRVVAPGRNKETCLF